MSNGLIFAIACALAAIVYGALSTRWILAEMPERARLVFPLAADRTPLAIE